MRYTLHIRIPVGEREVDVDAEVDTGDLPAPREGEYIIMDSVSFEVAHVVHWLHSDQPPHRSVQVTVDPRSPQQAQELADMFTAGTLKDWLRRFPSIFDVEIPQK